MQLAVGLLLPFLGTTLGAACVFFMKGQMKPLVQKMLLGFASGVMVAASVWSLLIPAMDMSEEMGKYAFIPAAAGFLLGILFLLGMDRAVPHLHMGAECAEGPKCSLKKTTMLVLAVTLHNIPEGMAVGVVFAGMLSQNTEITVAELCLSVGIAIQNFPEGAIISMPLKVRAQERKSLSLRNVVRSGGAGGGSDYHSAGRIYHAGASVPVVLCSRGHALCGRRGTDSGSERGRA